MPSKPLISFDYAIRYLLKDKGDHEIIESFLSALLSHEVKTPLTIKALLEPESNQETSFAKKSLADLVVEDQQGQKYIVEIERQHTSNFSHKACFNTSRLIVDSLESGDDFLQVKKVFHISLLYFKWGNMDKPLYHGKTIIRELDTHHPVDIHLKDKEGREYNLNHIFPEYYFISIPLFNDVVRSEIDEWLYLMKHDDVKAEFTSPIMQKVVERLKVLKMTMEEHHAYLNYRKEIWTSASALASAEERAEARGEARGEAKGEARGIKKGKIEVALAMLEQNVDLSTIAQFTGIPIDEIKQLIS